MGGLEERGKPSTAYLVHYISLVWYISDILLIRAVSSFMKALSCASLPRCVASLGFCTKAQANHSEGHRLLNLIRFSIRYLSTYHIFPS